jgi:hypothetical protein
MPVERLETIEWIHAPRLPLGDAYRGVCHAQPNDLFAPAESDQRDLCNCGYARDRCGRLPAGAPDALRFSVIGDAGGRVRIIWVIEKDHSPLEFGTLEYAEGELAFENFSATPLLTAQAAAFVRSYLDRASKQRSLLAGAGASGNS